MLPLEGVTVLDLSRVLAGPYCCTLLGNLGADVIKAERPGGGDESRAYGHLWHGVGLDFLNVNRNKRDITLNLRDERGAEIVRALIPKIDVLVENFTPGTMERFGLGYEDLKPLNERLIYCSISAYGEEGPFRSKPGYDGALQAFSGHMSVTGELDGKPVRTGASVIDFTTGISAYGAVVTALLGRRETGKGQKVAVSLLHTALALMGTHGAVCLNTGKEPKRSGSGVSHLAPYGAYNTSDSEVVVGALNEAAWQNLCRTIGRSELLEDERFATLQLRVANRKLLDAELEQSLVTKTTADWVRIFEAAGLVVAPVNTLGQALAHPQVAANPFVEPVSYPDGDLRFVKGPMTFGAWPDTANASPPALGQHTDGVLADLGYDASTIGALRAAGVI